MGLMTFLRSLAFNIWFYGVTAVLAISSMPAYALSRQSVPAWGLWVARLWARLTLGGLRVLCGTRWEVTGLEHLPAAGPAVVASMHQSAFDTMVWLLLVPRCCYVLKRELLDIPVFGAMCRLTGMIAVDRGDGAGAIRSLLRGADRAIAENRQIVIFPEGTRAPPGTHLPIQPGVAALASRTKLPVIPVVTDSGICWGRRAFNKRSGVIRIAIMAPLPAGMARDQLIRELDHVFAIGLQPA
jgi:1-acyl-sn-glycerol-3-phosphate acyltransferase